MYKHILIATDGSDLAGKAVVAGLELAKHLQAKATAVTATQPWMEVVTGEAALGFPLAEYEKAAADTAARILSAVSEAAQRLGVSCATVHAKEQYPADAILETAKAGGCDLIVMASHGRRGLGRLLLGSEAVRVLTHSTVPVLICR
jgi:nucleotide-binding universal stress UspA family protein